MTMDLTPEERAQDVRPFAELRESGLLWLINRVVFHPRGFALALVMSTETGEAMGWRVVGDGGEVWCFEGTEDGLFDAAKATLAEAALHNRPPSQVDPDQPLPDWERELLERQAQEMERGSE